MADTLSIKGTEVNVPEEAIQKFLRTQKYVGLIVCEIEVSMYFFPCGNLQQDNNKENNLR